MYYVNMNRIHAVVERIVKGLFFHHQGRSLAVGSHVTVSLLEQMPEDWLQPPIRGQLERAARKCIGEVFRYRHIVPVENGPHSVWDLEFYGGVSFVGITQELADAHR